MLTFRFNYKSEHCLLTKDCVSMRSHCATMNPYLGLLLVLTTLLVVQATTNEQYLYLVYYETNCSSSAVSFRGLVSNNAVTFTGAESGTCSAESICIIDESSPQCLAQTSTVEGTVNAFIIDGQIYDCDTSNPTVDQPECAYQDPNTCYKSSIFPSCTFKEVVSSYLFAHADLLQNSAPTDVLNQQVVGLYYTDTGCESVAGAKSWVVGSNTSTTAVEDTVDCVTSMACLFQPDGPACQALPTTPPQSAVVNLTNGSIIELCVNDTCVVHPSSECRSSGAYPGCFYQLVPGATFYANPQDYIMPPADEVPSPAPNSSKAPTADHLYLIYYNAGSDCSSSAVTVRGLVSGEAGDFIGVESGDCAMESLCIVDQGSPQCLAQSPTAAGTINATIVDGQIYECDTTNPAQSQPECDFREPTECYSSSFFPACQYKKVAAVYLVEHPEVLENASPTEALDQQVISVYYSDSNCQSFAGLNSWVNGSNTSLTGVDGGASDCQTSLSCLLQPDGATCQSLPALAPRQASVTVLDNSTVQPCRDGACETTLVGTCQPSTDYPACYHQFVPGRAFFASPATYITPLTGNVETSDAMRVMLSWTGLVWLLVSLQLG